MPDDQLFRNEAKTELENSTSREFLGAKFFRWTEQYIVAGAILLTTCAALFAEVSIDLTVPGVLKSKNPSRPIFADRDGVLMFVAANQGTLKVRQGDELAIIRSLDPEVLRRAPNLEFTKSQLKERKLRLEQRLKTLRNDTDTTIQGYKDLKKLISGLIKDEQKLIDVIRDDITRIDSQIVARKIYQKSGVYGRDEVFAFESRLVDRRNQLAEKTARVGTLLQQTAEYDLQINQTSTAADKEQIELLSQLEQIQLSMKTDQEVSERVVKADMETTLVPKGFSVGQLVKAGDILFETRDDSQGFLVESDISASEIGEIHEGQTATVALAAFPLYKYGIIDGSLKFVSAFPKTPLSYTERLEQINSFRTVIEFNKVSFDKFAGGKTLYPGMTAEVHIKKRSVKIWRLVLAPLLRLNNRVEL